MLSSKEILSMNLKYYRQKYNLSQEKFAEKLGSNLVYLNQIENCKRKPTIEMLDKMANSLNKFDPKLNITASDLIKYEESHKTHYSRIDEKKFQNSKKHLTS